MCLYHQWKFYPVIYILISLSDTAKAKYTHRTSRKNEIRLVIKYTWQLNFHAIYSVTVIVSNELSENLTSLNKKKSK